MIYATDVYYLPDDTAKSVCIEFSNWNTSVYTHDYTSVTSYVAPYQPGQFYKRELPCLTSI